MIHRFETDFQNAQKNICLLKIFKNKQKRTQTIAFLSDF